MYWMYILQLNNGSYYIGSTNNLKLRIHYHNYGRVRFTKKSLPCVLKYYEVFSSRSEAQKREYQIKSWKKRKAVERLIKYGPIV